MTWIYGGIIVLWWALAFFVHADLERMHKRGIKVPLGDVALWYAIGGFFCSPDRYFHSFHVSYSAGNGDGSV